ncbi:hypothetical protein DPMN_129165 [Dreissena polymorpha]|uniref:Uncharacterized protein n=1 Tax=Dreissena polymorpha TaxID=45954 RepID=A0A9D4H469_DREPO|nr:hypothetical protein DPMN_129165 [Dreissena polymorpha]
MCHSVDCLEGEFQCVTSRKCIAGARRCDTRRDCPDGSDEAKCREFRLLISY